MALKVRATVNGAPLDGPILTVTGGEVVLTELNQFSASSLRAALGVLDDAGVAAAQRAVLAMEQPYTVLEIEQEGVGTLLSGYVLNPQHTVDADGHSTITFAVEPLTVECTWTSTDPEWTASTNISTICTRLAAKAPGWTGTFTDRYNLDPSGQPYDIAATVTSNDATILAAWLDTAKKYGHYARQGVDSTGIPTRTLEMGQFGAAPTVTLQDAKGGDADALALNGTIGLVATVERTPNNVEDLVTFLIPLGGGTGETQVSLERPWRIVNDPLYPDYGRWGTDAQSLARTGKTSLFTEYDPLYPISDPQNAPTGATTWTILDSAGNVVTGPYAVVVVTQTDGTKAALVVNSGGVVQTTLSASLNQGAIGTRRYATTGRPLYCVYDLLSYAGVAGDPRYPAYGHKRGSYVDSGLNYADNSAANQELTAIALYVGATTRFKRYAHPHHTFSCTVANPTTLPTRAGDYINVDYQDIIMGPDATLVAADVTETLKVMRVVRTFPDDGSPPYDTYILSNLGRFDEDDASGQADTTRTITALQLNKGTGLAKDSVVIRDNVDAANPIIHWLYISTSHYRYHQVRVRCDFLPYRGTTTTAQNPNGTPVISADVEVSLATPGGLSAGSNNIPTIDTHVHAIDMIANTGGTPNVRFIKGSDGFHGSLAATSGGAGQISTNNPQYDTTHGHTVATAGATVAHITAGQRIAALPQHTHPVDQRIPTGQPSPASIAVAINGLALSSGVRATGTRNADGSFSSSFVISDIGPYLDQYPPGTDVPLTFTAGTNAGNLAGVGYLVVTITSEEELGGNVTTIVAS